MPQTAFPQLSNPSISSLSSVSLAFTTPTQTSATLEGVPPSLVVQSLQQVSCRVVLCTRMFDWDWVIRRQMGCVSHGVKIGIGVRLSLLDVGLVGLSKCVPSLYIHSLFVHGLYRQIIQLSLSRRPAVLLIINPFPMPHAEEGTPPPSAPAPLMTTTASLHTLDEIILLLNVMCPLPGNGPQVKAKPGRHRVK